MRKRNNYIIHSRRFFSVLLELMTSTSFVALTVLGNAFIVSFAFLFYYIEHGINPSIHSYIDAIWWSFATATTVGYGDITPITTLGKIVGIVLMISGTALFATYTALFAQAILEDDLLRLTKKAPRE